MLGLPLGASKADVKAAFRKLALKWHPDKNLGERHAGRPPACLPACRPACLALPCLPPCLACLPKGLLAALLCLPAGQPSCHWGVSLHLPDCTPPTPTPIPPTPSRAHADQREEAEKMFQEISMAYERLMSTDEDQRVEQLGM